MKKQTECILSSFRGASEIKKLEDTQRALISKSMNKYADRQSFSRQKRIASISSSLRTSYGSATETSVADVGKRKPCGYLTLLDISMLGGCSIPESSILSDMEFVPNSFHQQSHVSRWKSFVKKTPQWIVKMGIEGLDKQRNNRNKGAQIQNNKENLENKENSDRWPQKTKYSEGNKAHGDENTEKYAVEDTRVEMDFENERNEKVHEEDEISVCRKELRDWSLQLTENNSLVLTGNVDNNVISKSIDVSLCKRLDAHTLKFGDGSVYKLVGMPDHFTNLPCYVLNKFECGFPNDWKEVKLMWEEYINRGSPCNFNWTYKCRENSTMQKNNTSSRTEEAQVPSQLNRHILHRWSPVLIAPDKLQLTGYLESTCSPEVFHTTDIVAQRKDFDCLVCCDGTVYKLQGSFTDYKHNIPSPIQKLLHEGLPHRWKLMIRNWAKLLAAANGQEKETKQKNRAASVTNRADCIKSTKHVTCYDESSVAEALTASDISASDEISSINEGALRVQTYSTGSRIPLKELEGRGIMQTSSRGRLIVPPVRFWLGERLVQENNQPTFFSPRPGVTNVIVNQSVDHIGLQKKRKHSASEAGTMALCKSIHDGCTSITSDEKKSKLGTPKKEMAVLSHSSQSDQKQKVTTKAKQTRRGTEAGKLNARQKRLTLNRKEKYMQIHGSGETLLDGTLREARKDNGAFSKRKHNFKRPASNSVSASLHMKKGASKTKNNRNSMSASWRMKKGATKTKNNPLRSQKKGGLCTDEERNFSQPSHIYESEKDLLDGYGDDVLADMPININYKAAHAYSPLSTVSATPPTKYFSSMLDMDDIETHTLSPASPPWPQRRGKDIDRFIKRQQKVVAKGVRRSLLKPTAERNSDKLKTINDRVNAVFSVQFGVAEDRASSFDDEDLSS